MYAVFGDEAADGNEVAPTAAQIKTAITAADVTDLDETVGLIVARFKIQRVATDTITVTHTAVTTDASLLLERLYSPVL